MSALLVGLMVGQGVAAPAQEKDRGLVLGACRQSTGKERRRGGGRRTFCLDAIVV